MWCPYKQNGRTNYRCTTSRGVSKALVLNLLYFPKSVVFHFMTSTFRDQSCEKSLSKFILTLYLPEPLRKALVRSCFQLPDLPYDLLLLG